jgi:four helix bundle protein
MAQAAADAFQDRLVLFAVRIIDLVACLPKTTAGRQVGGQILRSGTSPAPNYAEARRAAQTSSTNSVSLLKSLMRPASGCSLG